MSQEVIRKMPLNAALGVKPWAAWQLRERESFKAVDGLLLLDGHGRDLEGSLARQPDCIDVNSLHQDSAGVGGCNVGAKRRRQHHVHFRLGGYLCALGLVTAYIIHRKE